MVNVESLAGQQIGQYELRRLVGSGAMGAVYLGHQTNLQRDIAIKVLSSNLSNQADYIERFNREALIAASLEHAHIVPIYDYGTEEGINYVVMRLLTGGSLDQRMNYNQAQERPLPSIKEVLRVLEQIASALDYAHSRGVVHRDIKASNVMFDAHGDAFIVDFGIAKLTESTSQLTGTGTALGTPSYMAPEQWRGEDANPASDQYATAVMAYALLTGQLPFTAPNPFALMQKHMYEAADPPSDVREDLTTIFDDIFDMALAKEIGDRYPSVGAFVEDLQNAYTSLDTNLGAVLQEPTGFFTTELPAAKAADPNLRTTPGDGGIPGPTAGPGTANLPDKPTTRVETGQQSTPVDTQGAPDDSPGLSRLWIGVGAAVAILLIGAGVFFAVQGGQQRAEAAAETETQVALNAQMTETSVAQRELDIENTLIALTPTATDTPTITPTPTNTDTPSPTPTNTNTPTPTDTNTPTPTDTPSPTPTDTNTPAPTDTNTPAPTDTSTPDEAASAGGVTAETPTATSDTTTEVPELDIVGTQVAIAQTAAAEAFATSQATPNNGPTTSSADIAGTQRAAIIGTATAIASAPQPTPAGPGVASLDDSRLDQAMLDAGGITADQLSLNQRAPQTAFDLSEEDNLIRYFTFDPLFGDFMLSTSFRRDEGASEDTCGVIFRRENDADYYRLDINQQSEILLFLVQDDEFRTLTNIATDRVNSTPGATNDLVVIHNGAVLRVFINGREMISLNEPTFTFGEVALTASTFDESEATGCNFSDTRIWDIGTADTALEDDPRLTTAMLLDSGLLPGDITAAEQVGRQEIDLTGEDDVVLSETLTGTYGNAVLAADVLWGPGANTDYCGFIFRRLDADNYYTTEIDRTGEARFFRREGGTWFEETLTGSDAIRTAPSDRNTLVLIQAGTVFTLYANDEEVLSFSNASFDRGQMGVLGGTFVNSDEAGCTFTNIQSWRAP